MNDVEEIKRRVDIVDFIGHYVTLKKAGSNYKAPCPFHDERTPSFMVSPEKQIFKCFGCGKGGDVIEFVMEQEGLDFKEALEMLADKAGVELKKPETRKLANSQTRKRDLYAINMAAAQVWHKILLEHPSGQPALHYLRGRKISDTTIKQWLIGFAPSQDTTRAYLQKRGFGAEAIKLAGSPDRFFKRIMFPLFDVIGNVAAFTGRASADNQEPKYLNTAESGLYHKSRYVYGLHAAKPAIKKLDHVIVVEGQMDVVASHQAGVTNVVATSGTALSRDHLALLARYSPNIVFAFDADDAGVKATRAALLHALDMELTVRIVKLPDAFKDVGEVVEKNPGLWRKTAGQALPWMEWLMPPAQFGSVEQKKKIAKEVLPFLARVQDPIEQSHWVRKLASMLAVKEDAIVQALARVRKSDIRSQISEKPTAKPLDPKEELYGLLLAFPKLQREFEPLFSQLKTWYTKETKPLVFTIEQRYAGMAESQVKQAIADVQARLNDTRRSDLKARFAAEIAHAERRGDRDSVKTLFAKLQQELAHGQRSAAKTKK